MPNRASRDIAKDRERRAWDMRMQGWTHDHIARELGVERSTITKALQRVSTRVVADLKGEAEQVLREQVGQLDVIAEQAMEAWVASKGAAKKLTKRTKGQGGQSGEVSDVTQQVEDKTGEGRYLQIALSAMADKRKLLGVGTFDPNERPLPPGATLNVIHIRDYAAQEKDKGAGD